MTSTTAANPPAAPPDTPGAGRFQYVPGLDGLRGFAVLVIIAYHAPASWAGGGFLSLELFFVLSGYLITSLLLAEYARAGRVALASFWARRARRLLTALLVVLGVLAAWAAWWADPIARSHYRRDALAALGYHANWRFIAEGASYFDRFSSPSPVRHLWSLAVEEQFYVLWPLLVVGLLVAFRGRAGKRAICVVALIGGLASAVAMATLYHGGDASRVYYGTDTHAFGLLFGAALATTPRWLQEHRSWRWLGLAGLVLLVVGFATLSDRSPFPYRGGIALASLLTVPIVLAAAQSGPVGRFLRWRPLVLVGLVSYGVYLWHWPIWAIVTRDLVGVGGALLTLIRAAMLAVAATASYILVERPIRAGRLNRRFELVAAPAWIGAIAVTVLIATAAPPLLAQTVALDASASAKAIASHNEPRVAIVGDSTAATSEAGFIADAAGYEPIPVTPLPSNDLAFCPLDQAMDRFRMVSGDVNAWQIFQGCRWRVVWPRMVKLYRPSVTLMMFSVWDAMPHEVAGQWLEPGTVAWAEHMTSELTCAVSILGHRGGRVLIVRAPSQYYSNSDWTAALNDVFDTVARADPDRVRTVEFPNAVTDAKTDARWDFIHYTPAGARLLADSLAPAIHAVLGAPPLGPSARLSGCPA